jgi:hypothetical protein
MANLLAEWAIFYEKIYVCTHVFPLVPATHQFAQRSFNTVVSTDFVMNLFDVMVDLVG